MVLNTVTSNGATVIIVGWRCGVGLTLLLLLSEHQSTSMTHYATFMKGHTRHTRECGNQQSISTAGHYRKKQGPSKDVFTRTDLLRCPLSADFQEGN